VEGYLFTIEPMLTKNNPVAAMFGISVVIILIALDQTIVGTALPRIVSELQGFGLYPWVAAAYLLTNATFIPVIGRLGDLKGRKPFLLAAIIVFTASSALCGLANNMLELVLARALQGAGGGMLVGSAFASVPDLFPDMKERVKWQIMMSSAFGIASAVGPALGGWMTEHYGWRSVFYVNLPIGLLALVFVWMHLPHIVHPNDRTQKGMDWWGVVLLVFAISGILATSEFTETLGVFSWFFWALLLSSLLFGYLFIKHQKNSTAPIVPAHLFESQPVRTMTVLAALTGFIMFVLIFYAPLLLQAGFSFTPSDAGFLVTPILVMITVGSIVNGRLITRVKKPQRLFSFGILFLMFGILLVNQIQPGDPRHYWIGVFSLCGFSLGFQIPNLIVQIQALVSKADLGVSSALVQTLRTLGGMFGASLGGVIVNYHFQLGVGQALSQAHISDLRVLHLFDTPQILIRVLDQDRLTELATQLGFSAVDLMAQARYLLINGIHEALYFCVILAFIGFLISLRLPNLNDIKKI
jgi:EmrB/QacA subfamily drug resistance transporter